MYFPATWQVKMWPCFFCFSLRNSRGLAPNCKAQPRYGRSPFSSGGSPCRLQKTNKAECKSMYKNSSPGLPGKQNTEVIFNVKKNATPTFPQIVYWQIIFLPFKDKPFVRSMVEELYGRITLTAFIIINIKNHSLNMSSFFSLDQEYIFHLFKCRIVAIS